MEDYILPLPAPGSVTQSQHGEALGAHRTMGFPKRVLVIGEALERIAPGSTVVSGDPSLLTKLVCILQRGE